MSIGKALGQSRPKSVRSNLIFYKITSLIFSFHGYLKKNSNLGNINSYGVTLQWIRKCTIFVTKKALSNEIVTFQEQVVNLQFLLTVVVIQIKQTGLSRRSSTKGYCLEVNCSNYIVNIQCPQWRCVNWNKSLQEASSLS